MNETQNQMMKTISVATPPAIVQPLRAAAPDDGQQTGVDDQQKREEDVVLRAVVHMGRDEDGEQQRQMRGRDRNPLMTGRTSLGASVPQRNCSDDGEDDEDRRAEREISHVQRLADRVDPTPFVERRRNHGERVEQPPSFSDREPGDSDVQRQEVGKQGERRCCPTAPAGTR